MNILELDSFDLADAVKFNSELNPALWQGQTMKPAVRQQLLTIAEDFKEFLGLSDIEVKDITVSGSNAGYTYTPNSDIDLHLVVDIPEADSSEVYRELFDAKKYQYNDEHNITIGGYEVELYVENANKPPVSQGVYSVLNDDWINIPRQRKATVDDDAVRSKYQDLSHRIDSAIKSKNLKRIANLAAKIKRMRQAGLDKHGELGSENLAYKMLRHQGQIEKLYQARTAAKDRKLSLRELAPKQRITYAYTSEDVGASWDGVDPTTCMFLNEEPKTDEDILKDFVEFCAKELKIKQMPTIKLRRDPQWSVVHKTFGRYMDAKKTLEVAWGQRHIMDVLRTVAHELTHKHQHERDGDRMGPEAGETGSKWENEANARAGILMRDYARLHPDYFAVGQAQELHGDGSLSTIKEASGYIPTAAQANDPRFEMALSVDVRPGAVGQAANAFLLNTDRQGHPQIARPSGIVDRMVAEFAHFKNTGKLLSEDQQLDEINMSPSSLKSKADKIDARAGMEFEMYVPNAAGGSDDWDEEPDMDYNESAYSIQQIADFFYDGDYNSRSAVRDFTARLEEAYLEWRDDKIRELWDEDGFEYYVTWVANNVDEETIKEWLGKADDEDYTPNKNDILDYANKLWGEDDDSKHDAYQEFRDENENDDDFSEEMWLDLEGIRDMEDVMNTFGRQGISWPYWTDHRSGGNLSLEEIASEFEHAVGKDTKAGGSYHSISTAKRPSATNQFYVVETDGSLDSPDSDEDTGLEFVSPAMSLDELFSDLDKIREWANRMGCYTNESTGLHMNVSVPGWTASDAGQGGTLDYVKLLLLMGDQYVLDQFDRASNTYCSSGLVKVQSKIKSKPELAQGLLDKMKDHLNDLASKILAMNSTNKYTSANIKDGYIEFRSPGGDWLKDLNENEGKIKNTMRRFVVAMDAAVHPDKDRKEYLKKLYKILAPSGEKSTIEYFAKYVAGELPKAALRSFIKQAQLERKIRREGEQFWWRVDLGNKSTEVIAGTEQEALALAAKEWSTTPEAIKDAQITNIGRHALNDLTKSIEWVVTMRPEVNPNFRMYVMAPSAYLAGELIRAGDPDLRTADLFANPSYRQAGVNTNNAPVRATTSPGPLPPSDPTGDWVVLSPRDEEVLYRFHADTRNDAERIKWSWCNANGVTDPDIYRLAHRAAEYEAPSRSNDIEEVPLDIEIAPPRSSSGNFTGYWKITDSNGRELHRFNGVGNAQADANRIAREWMQQHAPMQTFYVYPVMA